MKHTELKSLFDALEFARARLSKNVEQVKKNTNIQKNIIDSDKYESEDQDKIQEYYDENKARVQENNKLLEIQKAINNYLNEYKDMFEEDEEQNNDDSVEEQNTENGSSLFRELPNEDVLMEKTIKGEIKLNEKHPYIYDTLFLTKLLKALESREKYEDCAIVLKYLSFE